MRLGNLLRFALWRWIALGFVAVPALRALDPAVLASSYAIQGWFTEDGLPSNKIRSVIQSRDGYLWLATAQGIVRFDGSQFTTFDAASHPELGSGGFFAALEAPDGALWFGGDFGLFRWKNGRFDRYTAADGLAHDYVRGLALARDGAIVACTRRGFSFVRDGRVTTPDGIWKEVRGVCRAYLDRADGTTLLGTSSGLWRIAGGKIERLSGPGGIQGNAFLSLIETADGSAWIGYSGGVRVLRPDGKAEDFGPAHGLTSPRVAALREDRDGNLWIAASGNLYRLADGRIEPASYAAQLNGTPIHGFELDREGGLWMATVTGLFRLKDIPCERIGFNDGLAQTSVSSILETPDGQWWIGVWYGGVYRYNHSRALRVPALAALDLDRVFTFAADPDGALWIGSDTGLHRYANDTLTNFYEADQAAARQKQIVERPEALLPGLAHNYVNSLASDGRGGLWIATEGALYHKVAGEFRAYTTRDGLPGDVFESVLCARNGDVWTIASSLGVSRFRDGQWTNFRCGQELSANRPLAVVEDSAGSIWVTTDGGGLSRFKDGRWRTFTTRDGLAHDFISGIVEDKAENLWIAYPRGIMRIPRREFDELERRTRTALQPRIFNTFDGLPRGETNPFGTPNALRIRDGRLLFATDRGVAVVDPNRLRINEQKPPVYIERLVINGTDADLSKPVVIAPGRADLQIQYTAISLLAPEKVRFKIRLAPLDADWVDNDTRRTVHYARLPAGNYVFHVKGCNNDGVWNEESVALRFTIRPFFYQTPWFIALVVMAAGVAGFGFYWNRRARAVRQMAVLSGLVAERTRELQTAKEQAEAAVLARNESIAALKQSQEEVAAQRARFKFIFESVPVGIAFVLPGKGTFLVNPAHDRITGLSADEVQIPGAFDRVTHPDDLARQRSLTRKYAAGEIDHFTIEKRYRHPEGKIVWASLTRRMFTDPATGAKQSISTLVDITERKNAEVTLAETHKQLLDISRQAGMAEVATGVLHNVGNVLNSVNVSATLVIDRVRESKAAKFTRVSAILREQMADLPRFLTTDPKGQRIPGYLITLADQMEVERKAVIAELENLRKNVEHIKEIVSMQQSYAKVSGVFETVAVSELVEDALRINAGALSRHGLEIVRQFEADLPVTVERHKVLQILVNLIRNAKHACDDSGRTDKRLTVRVARDDARMRVSIIDNGVGIPAENLTRIFAHGFTTRKNGHGFGLHSGALAAKELGGSLTAHSDGPGLGAAFTLELPFKNDSST
jgi:PAS domain S-box-containing protein